MSLWFRGRQKRAPSWDGTTARDLVPMRTASTKLGSAYVDADTALRHSAVWACCRLRANLVSTLPLDVFRAVEGLPEPVEVPKPPVLIAPGGDEMDYHAWMFATQFDLDRTGNSVGVIAERDRYGFPARIDLVAIGTVSVVVKAGKLTNYRINGKLYDPKDIWHERQYTISGLHVGLSPIAYAAWSIGEYLSIGEFALNWFGKGGIPKAALRNTEKIVDASAAAVAKARWMEQTTNGDVAVFGKDWEYEMIQAEQTGSEWLEAKKYSITDVARFMDCPGDLIDAAVQGSNITYANVVQRNLQFLVMSLDPTLCRREATLSKLLPAPRFARINRNALLRMDPLTRAQFYKLMIDMRAMTQDEVRSLEDRAPLTSSDIAQLDHFFPPKAPTPFGGGAPAGSPDGSPQKQPA